MKTRKVELKGFVGCAAFQKGPGLSDPRILFYKDKSVPYPATLTIEVPVEEKSVTITESEFDEALSAARKEWHRQSLSYPTSDEYGAVTFLKSKLFGEG